MRPTFQPGIRFEWSHTIPERANVPKLYHDTPFCLELPEVLAVEGRRVRFKVDVDRVCAGTHERCVIDTQRFNDKLAGKIAQATT